MPCGRSASGRTPWSSAFILAQVFTGALARRRADRALRESEARLEAGAELGGLGFYEVDFRERTAYFDERLRDVLGLPPELWEGLQPVEFWTDHLHPDDRERMAAEREELHSGRLATLSTEYRYLHPARGERWMSHVARVAARDADGRTVKSYGVLRDITEGRKREEALRQSYAEIARLKDRLQAESDYLKAEIRVIHAHGEVNGQSPAIHKVLGRWSKLRSRTPWCWSAARPALARSSSPRRSTDSVPVEAS